MFSKGQRRAKSTEFNLLLILKILSIHTTVKCTHDQQRNLVYVPYIFGKSGFIPCLLPFLSSLLLLLQHTPSKPNVPFSAQEPKGKFVDYKFE